MRDINQITSSDQPAPVISSSIFKADDIRDKKRPTNSDLLDEVPSGSSSFSSANNDSGSNTSSTEFVDDLDADFEEDDMNSDLDLDSYDDLNDDDDGGYF